MRKDIAEARAELTLAARSFVGTCATRGCLGATGPRILAMLVPAARVLLKCARAAVRRNHTATTEYDVIDRHVAHVTFRSVATFRALDPDLHDSWRQTYRGVVPWRGLRRLLLTLFGPHVSPSGLGLGLNTEAAHRFAVHVIPEGHRGGRVELGRNHVGGVINVAA